MQRKERGIAEREIHVQGVFDTLAAHRVEATLSLAEPHARLQVDLSQVREFHDAALAVLAQAVKSSAADVALRGLRQHQIRMLRYFGVDTPPHEQDRLS